MCHTDILVSTPPYVWTPHICRKIKVHAFKMPRHCNMLPQPVNSEVRSGGHPRSQGNNEYQLLIIVLTLLLWCRLYSYPHPPLAPYTLYLLEFLSWSLPPPLQSVWSLVSGVFTHLLGPPSLIHKPLVSPLSSVLQQVHTFWTMNSSQNNSAHLPCSSPRPSVVWE